MENRLTLDTDDCAYFYEQDLYVLSSFSAFTVAWQGEVFYTAETLYHWLKFDPAYHNIGISKELCKDIRDIIARAQSAHDAFKIAHTWPELVCPWWKDIRIEQMKMILKLKASQHEYVRRKLLSTGDKMLIENSWRDDFWGWGPNRDGQNMMGKLWMEVRKELR